MKGGGENGCYHLPFLDEESKTHRGRLCWVQGACEWQTEVEAPGFLGLHLSLFRPPGP